MVVPYWLVPAIGAFEDGLKTQLIQVTPAQLIKNSRFSQIKLKDLFDSVYLPEDTARMKKVVSSRIVNGRIEGQRSTTLDNKLVIGGQEFAVNVKGSGALYSDSDSTAYVGFTHCLDDKDYESFSAFMSSKVRAGVLSDYRSWDLSERPLGGQRYDWALDDLSLSDGVFSKKLGMYICPVVSMAVVPQNYVLNSSPTTDDKLVAQELRLLPSNVRLSPDQGMVGLFDMDSQIYTDDFVENLVKTAIQISTLPLRSVKKCSKGHPECLETLIYDRVYPNKDAVIARDGKMYFADLEGIETGHYLRAVANKELSILTYSLLSSTLELICDSLDRFHGSDGIRKYLEIVNVHLPGGLYAENDHHRITISALNMFCISV